MRRQVSIGWESWAGSRSALVIRAFELKMPKELVPVEEITEINESQESPRTKERKLTKLAREHGVILEFHD